MVVFARRWARHCVVERVRYCAGRSKTVTLRARVSNAVARESDEIVFMSSPVGLSEGIRQVRRVLDLTQHTRTASRD